MELLEFGGFVGEESKSEEKNDSRSLGAFQMDQ